MSIIEIETEEQFDEVLVLNDKVIVFFYSQHNQSCKKLLAELPKIQETYPDVTILKINTELSQMEDVLSNHDVGKVPHSVYYIKNVQHGGNERMNCFAKIFVSFLKSFTFSKLFIILLKNTLEMKLQRFQRQLKLTKNEHNFHY